MFLRHDVPTVDPPRRPQLPFPEARVAEYCQRVIAGGERPPIRRAWPRGIASLLERCWDPAPARRPQMREVVCAVDALIEDARGGAPELTDRPPCAVVAATACCCGGGFGAAAAARGACPAS